jgi:hypothetical protein
MLNAESIAAEALAPIPGVPAGRRVHDVDPAWAEGRDHEAMVRESLAGAAAGEADESFPTKLVWVGSNGKYTPANRTSADVYYVFVHSSEGSYWGAIDWMQNGPVSASYWIIVKEDGSEAAQMVSGKDIAWAGGTSYSNAKGLHICMAGYAARGFSDAQMKATAAWVRYGLEKFEVPIQFAFDINNSTKRQLLRAGLAGHEHIPGADHTDPFADDQPGHRQRWEKFMGYVKGGSAPAPKPVPKPPGAPVHRIVLSESLPKGKQLFVTSKGAERAKEIQTTLKQFSISTEVKEGKAPAG